MHSLKKKLSREPETRAFAGVASRTGRELNIDIPIQSRGVATLKRYIQRRERRKLTW